MKTVAFLLWYHAATEAKSIEMNEEIGITKEKCESIQPELKETKEESEKKEIQLREESKEALEKKERTFACSKAIQSLSNVLILNEKRKKAHVFNRWNVLSSSIKTEEEVKEMKDQQRNEEVNKLTQEHEATVTTLKKEHSDEVTGLIAKHTQGTFI